MKLEVALEAAPALRRRDAARKTRSESYAIETLGTAAEIVARVERAAGAATVFQDAAWLRPVYDALAPALGAQPFGVVVTEQRSGALAAILPLVVRREGPFNVASFAHPDVSDYGAPILGPAAPEDREGAARLWQTVARGLAGVDLVRLGSMPHRIDGRVNPLALLDATTPSRHSSHVVTVPDTVEAFLRSLGKKYRKEVERCFRLLDKEGAWTFSRAETADDIAAAYAALESQQRERHRQAHAAYRLDRPAVSDFYARLLAEGTPRGTAHLFTLKSGGGIIATLLGVSRRDTFTLLRISNGGAAWRHLSPGRLIVVESMRYFTARGVNRFDMGIGDYPFKEGFHAAAEPLLDLERALTWKALPQVLARRAKACARRSPTLSRLVRTIRRRK